MSNLVINKTYAANQILGEVNLDNAFNSIAAFINGRQIGADNIQDNSITPAELQTSSVTSAKIANGAVTTAKIADGAITLDKLASDIILRLSPPGKISAYAGIVIPQGWLICDGMAVSRATYSVLFTAIGVAHGSGDGTTTFNLPDYRGRFLRGVDDTAGRDLDKANRTASNPGGATGDNVGSVQDDMLKSHTHHYVGATAGSYYSILIEQSGLVVQGETGATGGTETRPKNAYVIFMIKV